ncbi:Charged multivesicular body protein 5 [Neolecta irregularis DAH-3]|uniref:Charged multivesicular body protein 5 n=1 Tax=Neolecta irregularis (strain DAH-3) TaxID=1198029 RepID=A0A1U7LL65_NEOID|nr:Charged multivesicular body protein 5 [Neolecta irregularis DAH-3]|eukprot:OLL23394.1 Charged multivesicular body protein 5 [Neolecta irregularis DAH-3]
MNRLLGYNRTKAPKPSLTDAIASTDSRIESIDLKIRKLDSELQSYRDKLQKLRDGPGKNAIKQKALKVLRQKKQYEAQRDQLQSQTFNMEQAAMQTENLKNVMTTFDAMKTANKELKKTYGKKLHDEMADLMDSANDLQESLSRGYDVPDDISESELDAELDALGEEWVNEQAEGAGSVPSYLQDAGDLPDFIDEPVENKEKKEKVTAG